MSQNSKGLRAQMVEQFHLLSKAKGLDSDKTLEEAKRKLIEDLRDEKIPPTITHVEAMLFGIKIFESMRQKDDGMAAFTVATLMAVADKMETDKAEAMKAYKGD